MSTQRITFGQYNGLTFEDLLDHDLSYCQYIHRLPVNKRNKDFKEWLCHHLKEAEEKDLQNKQKILHSRLTNQ